ncbi:MAG: Crp/Fnr family transcriptional regulator [Solirubrobacterales bacterium]|nr:Crp/Fnr family transcriptional regulator [Solirubrobacterales bacterium]MCB8915243.1 Crp/Fnr family transcriptional regulator [Thermoleophilales bacterium]
MFGEPEGSVRLLDAEPSLARGMERRLLDEAREKLTVEVRRVEPGDWEESRKPPSSPQFLGYLILEGTLIREISVASRPSLELLGPGDLIRTWVVPQALAAMHVTDEWALLSTGHIAIIDESFHELAQDYPSILTVLMDRVVARARWLGFQVALCQLPRIDHRLLLTFRYLAERWGVKGANGVKIPIRLSHRNLAALIGARRPKVSSALATLSEGHLIDQAPDGTWTFFAADIDPMAVLAGIDDLPDPVKS